MDADPTPATPAPPTRDLDKLEDMIWKPGDPPGELGKELEWKWVRTHTWSFDINDPHGFPPPHTLLDDYLTWKILKSELSGEERFRRWPINFLPGGNPNGNLGGIGRAAKILDQGVWYYVRWGGVELHGQEGGMAGLQRMVNISTSDESSSILQTAKAAAKDIKYTVIIPAPSSDENRRGNKSAQTVLANPNHDPCDDSLPSSPVESKKRTYESISGFPPSSKRKMMVREEIAEKDDTVLLLRRAVINFQELLLKADELMNQLRESRSIHVVLNAWRGVALQYNLLSDDIEELL